MTSTTIYQQAKECLNDFSKIISILNTDTDRLSSLPVEIDQGVTLLALEDAKARFRAWGTNIAAFHDSKLGTSLDFRLRGAPDISGRALQVIEDLKEYISDLTFIILGEKPNESWSLSDSSDSSDEETSLSPSPQQGQDNALVVVHGHQELLKAITTSVASLMKLSILIRSSSNRDDYAKAASRYNTWSPYPDIGHVRETFGKARYSQPWLLDRLGKSITRRRQFLKYRDEHHGKLVEELLEEDTKTKAEKTIASTKATTFIATGNPALNLQKPASEFGGSFGSLTSYDPTVFGADGAPKLLSVPPPPKFAFPGIEFSYGEVFQCPYCFTEQIVNNKSAWKKHVFRDLKPYVCTFEGCEMLLFKSRKEWFTHELRTHRREWLCQFCDHDTFPTKDAFVKHTKSAHAPILASSSLDAILLQSEEQVDRIPATACNLCDKWEEELRRRDGNSKSLNVPAAQVFGPLRQFRRHMAGHLEQLALFAINQNRGNTLDDDSEKDDDDNPESADGNMADATSDDNDTDVLSSTSAIDQGDSPWRLGPPPPAFMSSERNERDNSQSTDGVAADNNSDPDPGLNTSPTDKTTLPKVDRTSIDEVLEFRLGKGEALTQEDLDEIARIGTASTISGFDPEEHELSSDDGLVKRFGRFFFGSKEKTPSKSSAGDAGLSTNRKTGMSGTKSVNESTSMGRRQQQPQNDEMTVNEFNASKSDDLSVSSLDSGPGIGGLLSIHPAETRQQLQATEEATRKREEELERLRKEKEEQEEEENMKREREKATEKYELEKEEREKEYQRRLEDDLRKSGLDQKQIASIMKKESPKSDIGRPTYTRMARRHLSIETLNRFQVDYEFDQNPDYVLIKRWVPEYEQDFWWSHTQELREKRIALLKIEAEEKHEKHYHKDEMEFEFVRKRKLDDKIHKSRPYEEQIEEETKHQAELEEVWRQHGRKLGRETQSQDPNTYSQSRKDQPYEEATGGNIVSVDGQPFAMKSFPDEQTHQRQFEQETANIIRMIRHKRTAMEHYQDDLQAGSSSQTSGDRVAQDNPDSDAEYTSATAEPKVGGERGANFTSQSSTSGLDQVETSASSSATRNNLEDNTQKNERTEAQKRDQRDPQSPYPPLPEWAQQLTERERKRYHWVSTWSCHNCQRTTMLSTVIDQYCTECFHQRCEYCSVEWMFVRKLK